MWKTIDIWCGQCQAVHIVSVDVPSGESLPQNAPCEVCGCMGIRKLSAGILKHEVAERTHGPEIIGGKAISRTTGFDNTRRQLDLKKELTKAKRQGNQETAVDVAKELVAVQAETVKKLKGE